MANEFSVEVNGKLLDVHPEGGETLIGAVERVVSADVGEPIRESKCVPRMPAFERALDVTFESGISWRVYVIPREAQAT